MTFPGVLSPGPLKKDRLTGFGSINVRSLPNSQYPDLKNR